MLGTDTQPPARDVSDRCSKSISVVIPVHNGSRFVAEAIVSALGQTYALLECIVVDDGSTDSTPQVVRAFPEVRYLRLEHGGVSRARNHGAAHARGDFVAFLDHDDVWLARKLELQVNALEADGRTVLVLCAVEMVDPTGTSLGFDRLRQRSDLVTGMLLQDGTQVPSCSSTGLFRRDWLLAEGFDPELSMSADWDLTLRAALTAPVAYVDEPLVRYRVHDANMSWNLALLERDKRYAVGKALSDPRVPELLRKQRGRALGRMYRMLAGSYRDAGRWRSSARTLMLAIGHDPRLLGEELGRLAKRRSAKVAAKAA